MANQAGNQNQQQTQQQPAPQPVQQPPPANAAEAQRQWKRQKKERAKFSRKNLARNLPQSADVFFWIFVFLAIFLFFTDLANFFRRGGYAGNITYGYLVVTGLYFLIILLKDGNSATKDHVVFGFRKLLFTLVIPLLAARFQVPIQNWATSAAQASGLEFLFTLLVDGYQVLALALSYFLGWTFYAVSQAAEGQSLVSKIFALLNIFIGLALLATAVSVLFSALSATDVLDSQGLQVPSGAELFGSMWNQITTATSALVSGTISAGERGANATRQAVLPTRYTATVERQQGGALGVFLVDLEPLKNAFVFDWVRGDPPTQYTQEQYFTFWSTSSFAGLQAINSGLNTAANTVAQTTEDATVEQDFLIPRDQQAVFFGTIRARTFAEQLNVILGCHYEVGRQPIEYSAQQRSEALSQGIKLKQFLPERIITGKIRPDESVNVYYTADFHEEYPFDCTFDMHDFGRAIEDGPNAFTREDLNGQFFATANFSFKTWGYVTLPFMDRDQVTALKREGVDPAREFGYRRTAEAFYTPGPIELGLESITLPIGVRTLAGPEEENFDPHKQNFLPGFGITVENSWRVRGTLEKVEEIVLQVPQPFVLNISACTGFEPQKEKIIPDGTVQELAPQETTPVEVIILPGRSTQSIDTQGFRSADQKEQERIDKTFTFNVHSVPSEIGDPPKFVLRDEEEYEITDSYTWYVFRNFNFPDDVLFKTFRCPVQVYNHLDTGTNFPGWSEVLGPDLTLKEYTFVAMINYDYQVKSPVAMRLVAERIET